MEGKLIKKEDGYVLGVQNNLGTKLIATNSQEQQKILDKLGVICEYKLSLKNCQSIERGYDLDELAKDCEITPTYAHEQGFITGFQKALELLGDKKFNEKLLVDFVYFLNDRHFNNYTVATDEVDLYLESLQQTEWDVEIEMEQYVKYVPKSLETVYPTGGVRPKLDKDRCLILKRK